MNQLYQAALSKLPSDSQRQPGWRALLLIFTDHSHLRGLLPQYADLAAGEFDVERFRAEAWPVLSDSEQVLAGLAFYLFDDGRWGLPAGGLRNLIILHWHEFELAMTAIRVAAGRSR